jgi:hypothetical protein
MARSASIDCLAFHNFSLDLDSMVIKYDETKADKAGEKLSEVSNAPNVRSNVATVRWERSENPIGILLRCMACIVYHSDRLLETMEKFPGHDFSKRTILHNSSLLNQWQGNRTAGRDDDRQQNAGEDDGASCASSFADVGELTGRAHRRRVGRCCITGLPSQRSWFTVVKYAKGSFTCYVLTLLPICLRMSGSAINVCQNGRSMLSS